jgi:2-polyprenyl-3-methyl-5-hydroxy-6-metoxy-1,4-benzoquinol methylase
LIPEGKFISTKIEEFVPERKFDTILMINILEHVGDPVKILQKITEWLSDDGKLIIQVPNADALNRRLGVKMGLLSHSTDLSSHDKEIGHQRMFNLETLINTVKNANLNIIKSGGFFLKPLTNHQMQMFNDSKIMEDKIIKKNTLMLCLKQEKKFQNTLVSYMLFVRKYKI